MERDTAQRRAIRASFDDARRPLSAHEVLEAATQSTPSLGLATVYRNLKALVEQGILVPVEMPGESPRYELAGLSHHHHFHCRVCGKVYDIAGCPGDLKSLAPAGFVIEDHEIVLYGTCAACAAKETKRRRN